MTSKSVIVDVGCRWGFAEKFLKCDDLSQIEIYGFDPDIKECNRLNNYYEDIGAGAIKCVPIALGQKEGVERLYITKEPACSSLYKPNEGLINDFPALECIRLVGEELINVTKLKTWMNLNKIEIIDYLKIDTQGSELDVLVGAGDELFNVSCIDIEVEFNEIYEGQPLFSDVDKYLRGYGFELWRISSLVHYSKYGRPKAEGDVNTLHHDLTVNYSVPSAGGKLFWSDARYINTRLLKQNFGVRKSEVIRVLKALKMWDVVEFIV